MTEIAATKRENVGTRLNSLRKEGILPAVLYGEGVASTPISVQMKEFKKVLRQAGETSLLTLKVRDGKDFNVLIYDVAVDPLTGEPIHADFYAVRMDKPIEAKVPLVFLGESAAVKNDGGILVKIAHELEVKALPKDLPHEISVDVTKLEKIGDKIHVRDLILPAGVIALAGEEEVVALIEPPRSEVELEELAKTAEAAPTAEVKTEREMKVEAEAVKAAEEKTAEE